MALGAYFIWGLLPLYLRLVHQVPPFEFIGWRILFTLPFCLVVMLWRGEWHTLTAALARPRLLAVLTLSSALIAVNWTIYVVAIQGGHVLAASLGYYINPLANVLAGTLVLKEKLTRLKWLAVALAAAGVSLLAWDARDMLWISLSLAGSFCGYGLVRKLAPVESLPGLTIETLILLLPAAATVGWFAIGPQGSSLGHGAGSDLLIMFAGVITGAPLLLFAAAARRLDYSTIGMTQYLAPTIVFVLGLTVFGEPLKPVQLACFVLIWCAIAVFVWDALGRLRTTSEIHSPSSLEEGLGVVERR